jgi:putative ABC transport system permease protein
LYDETLNMILSRWSSEGVETRRTIPLRVAGVLQETRGESDYSMYVRLSDLEGYNQWLTGRRVNRTRDGYPTALVKARDSSVVLGIADQVTALGYQAYTPLSFVQGINSFFAILQVVFGGVGAIALLVAAIGIANTMTMAILERTREIGLMKAIGATNRNVMSIFLGEAAGIGLLGGVGGVAVAWVLAQVINVLAAGYLANQAAQMGAESAGQATYIAPWLPAFALIFSTLVGLISGLYPALRAATMIPVLALKYE